MRRKMEEDKARIGRRNKAIKTEEAEGGLSPFKFTGEGYLTCLPVPGRASAIRHARKKKKGKRKPKQMRRKKKRR